jgi:hypothetical protein
MPYRFCASADGGAGGDGIGFSWGHDLHLYFKHARASEVASGDATWHRERVARLMTV